MNWGRIKTILIILFLFTDIFLAYSIFTAEKKETQISPEVIDSAIKILSEHNISVDKSIISAKIPSAPILQADNVISDYSEFARLLLGENVFSESDNEFHTKNAKLVFSGDSFKLEYLVPSKIPEITTLNDAQKFAFSHLKGLGFNLSDAKAVSSNFEDGIYRIKICDYSEGMPIYSSEANISLSKNGIISISGSWFNRKDNSGQNNNLKSITGTLVDFAASYNGEVPAEIKSIELGYSVFDDATYHKSASLIPVTKIQLNDGNEYFMDSRSYE